MKRDSHGREISKSRKALAGYDAGDDGGSVKHPSNDRQTVQATGMLSDYSRAKGVGKVKQGLTVEASMDSDHAAVYISTESKRQAVDRVEVGCPDEG